MRKGLFVALLAMFITQLGIAQSCGVCCEFQAVYEDCHDFDNFVLGDLIPQGNPKFTLFPNTTQGAQVVLSPTDITNQCVILFNDSNIDYNINQGIDEGQPTRLEWEMLIPTDKSGEWGLEVEPNSAYRYVVRYNSGMAAVYTPNSNGVLTLVKSFTYSDTTWFKHAIIFKPSTDSIELWLNKTKITTIGGFTNNKISQLNFYGVQGATQNEFYIDNLCFRIGTGSSIACTAIFDPVCVSGVQYNNSCLAGAAGYACEFTPGPCSVNPIGCSTFTAPDNLSTGIDPRVNFKWTQAVGATSYRLLVGTTLGGSNILNLNVGNVLGYSITLQTFTTYFATIIPTNGTNTNATCIGITFTTGAIPTCNVCCAYSSSVADCYNFENLSVGNLITQVEPNFTLFSPSSIDGFIVNTPVFQGVRSLSGINGTNVDYNINTTLGVSQAARTEWNILVPAGKSGSWGIETNAANTYPLGMSFENGVATITRRAGNNNVTLATINYSPNNWMKIAVIFQPQDDEIELFINNVFVYKVVNYTSNQIGQINFAALPNKNNTEFYIDNLCYRAYDINTPINNTPIPVCVNNENFTNLGFAEAKGYSSCEVTPGTCSLKPGCPTIVTPTQGQLNVSLNPIVTWIPVTNALGYRITVIANGITTLYNEVDVQSATSFQLVNLPSNTFICIFLNAYNAAGSSVDCVETCFTTLQIIQVPVCPQVTFPLNMATDVPLIPTITWNPGAFALGYRITVTTNNGSTTLINNRNIFNVTSYEIGPLPQNTQVCVRITPYNNSGQVPTCTQVCFTTIQTIVVPNCTTITTPTANAQNVPINTTIAWLPAPTATGYKVNVTASGGTILFNNLDVGNDLLFPLIDLPFASQICVRITPYNQAGDRLNCLEHCFTTVSATATVPSCVNITYPLMDELNVLTSINAVWNASSAADGYIVRLVDDNGVVIINDLDIGNVTSYIINGLPFSTRLCLNIIPYNATGQNLNCDSRCFTTVSSGLIPTCPMITYPTEDGPNIETEFIARWNPAAGATGYLVRLTQENGPVIIDNENIVVDSIIISNLTIGVSYCLNVFPYNAVGQNLTCTATCFTIGAAPQIPSCPTITYPTEAAVQIPTSFNATWTGSPNATGYLVSLITQGGVVIADSIDVGLGLTYGFDNLASDSIYCLTITPYNAVGINLACEAVCFGTTTTTIQLPTCAAVTYPLSDELNVLTSIDAIWAASPTATGYVIRLVQADGTVIINNVNVGNVTNYTINNLPNGVRLCLTVIPYNDAGQNLNCTPICFTTVSIGEVPICATITFPTSNAIDIATSFVATWSASPTATGYLIKLEEENGAVVLDSQDVANVTSFAINNLANSKRYCLTVIPYNAIGQNLNCFPICFTTIANGNLATCPMINFPSADAINISTSFLARWSSSPAATGYLIRLEEENGPIIINNLNLGNLNAYRFDNLPNNKRLCLSVYPYSAAGQNLTCTKLCFTTAMTSATDDQLANQIAIYPNPTNNKIIIESGSLTIQKISLTSIVGSTHIDYQQPLTEIDMTNFVAGVYLLKLYTGSTMIVRKVVKVD